MGYVGRVTAEYVQNTGFTGTQNLTVTKAVAAGHRIVVVANAAAVAAVTGIAVSDSKSTVYTQQAFITAAALINGQVGIVGGVPANGLAIGDTITVVSTGRNPQYWNIAVLEFDDLGPFDVATPGGNGGGTAIDAGSATSTQTDVMSLMAVVSITNGPPVTFPTGWTKIIEFNSGGTSDHILAIGYRYTTTGTTRSGTATLTNSNQWAAIVAAWRHTSAAPPVTTPVVKIWDGTAWVTASRKMWSGTAWA